VNGYSFLFIGDEKMDLSNQFHTIIFVVVASFVAGLTLVSKKSRLTFAVIAFVFLFIFLSRQGQAFEDALGWFLFASFAPFCFGIRCQQGKNFLMRRRK